MTLAEGQLITAPFLPGPARIKKVEQRSAFYRLEVVLEETGEYRPLRLSAEQVAQISLVERDPLAMSGDPEEFFLLVEANRIRLAHQFDPLLAVSVSQVDPLPHQIEAVYHYALDLPRIRFLIADDPGAGKTVMAGLILKEMQYRRLAQRVLIVAPGHLKYQWQREMKEKFNTAFRLIDRSAFHAAWGENVWEEHPHAITSIDFLKQDDIKATLNSAHWDLIIVDEAHKMSAYAYETRDRVKIDKTKRYQVGEVLSRQSDHLLFLTATPHRGDEENFRLFLDLLRPGFFAKPELLHESVERQDNPLFVRRLKEDMKTFDGRDIFPPRHVQTLSFKMRDAEMRLYNEVTSYVKNYFDQARENRNITFAMIILQRRLTSSVHAILSSLQRRRDRLEELLRLPEKIRGNEKYEGLKTITEEDLEDMAEEERWEIEERLEHLTIARNIEDVHREIEQLDGLIEQAKVVRAQEEDRYLLTKERAEGLLAQIQVEPPSAPPPGPGPQPPGPEPGVGDQPEGLPPKKPKVETGEGVKQFVVRASGISTGRIADLNRGVLQPLVREVGEFTFTVEIDVKSSDGIPRKVIEQQVIETLRQLGAKFEVKDGD